ncbi:MAG: LPS export ABC transporter periplasmic protein LptC [Spirulinaceae cyanobacterium RM2_2_10]|nr:LPS export ABC transporter periplasmic protein LptC [Spirulinaceae cyanobacterium RM2_2_10]
MTCFNHQRRRSWLSWWLGLGLLSLAACQPATVDDAVNGDREPVVAEQLVLRNATLEQADESGNVLWKINAQRTSYSEDKQTATLEDLTGNLLQDGEIILKVRAAGGEVRLEEDGEKVFSAWSD